MPHRPKHSDLFYKNIEQNIRNYGVHLMGVYPTPESPGPGFTYTIGLYEKFKFEVIIFALPFNRAGIILNDVAKSLMGGYELEPGRILGATENPWVRAPVKFEKAKWERAKDYVVQAYRYYKIEPELLTTYQMVVPDRNFKFPESPDYEWGYMGMRQPLLYKG